MLIDLGWDSETTGSSLANGCKPFFVSTCDAEGSMKWWEWPVDPYTRLPDVPDQDKISIGKTLRNRRIVGQNSKYDLRALSTIGFSFTDDDWDNVHDTLIASHCLDSASSHGLKDLALHYLEINDDDQQELREATNKARAIGRKLGFRIAEPEDPHFPSVRRAPASGFWVFDTWLPRAIALHEGYDQDPRCGFPDKPCKCHPWWHVLARYAITDAERTMGLWLVFEPALKEEGLWEIYETRRRLLKITYEMEETGITVHEDRIITTQRQYESLQEDAQAAALKAAEYKLDNLNSTQQLQGVIYGHFGLTGVKETKTGYSTDKDSLRALVESLEPEEPAYQFLKHLTLSKSYAKAIDYLESYRLSILDGQIHTSFNVTGTATTRFSSSNPVNSQNIPKAEEIVIGHERIPVPSLRSVFGPQPGREWFSIDFSNIELRLFAYQCGDERLIKAFEEGNSVHMIIAEVLHPEKFIQCAKEKVDFKKKYKLEYGCTKNGNFCVPRTTQALTAKGWRSYSTIEVGDMVLGYDQGVLRWTPVLQKSCYEPSPLIAISNQHFRSVTTPNHRWIGKRRTGRGPTKRDVTEIFTTENIKSEHTILLAAPVEDECLLDITPEEAAIIGFAYGDGHLEMSKFVGAPSQAGGRRIKFRVRLFQSKAIGIEYLENLLARWGGQFKRRGPEADGKFTWELHPETGRDIWRRAGLWDTRFRPNMEQFVLNLGTRERQAYLEAIFQAEGHVDSHGCRLYTQNCGSFAESIRLAVFMCGNFPTTTYGKDYYGSNYQISRIRASKPHVTGQRLKKQRVRNASIWCINTALGSWVIRDGEHIMLTGNSLIYGASQRKADATYRVEGAYSRIRKSLPLIDKFMRKKNKEARDLKYVTTLGGYRLKVPSDSPHVAVNYFIQGSAGWAMILAMLRVYDYLHAPRKDLGGKSLHDMSYRMIMTIHDEIDYDFPTHSRNKQVITEIAALMAQSGDDLGVPTPVDISWHPENWGTSKPLDEYTTQTQGDRNGQASPKRPSQAQASPPRRHPKPVAHHPRPVPPAPAPARKTGPVPLGRR